MVCHLVKSEGCLGRSTVIDLLTDSASKFRQVDHRSIIEITLRNVKYLLKSGGKRAAKLTAMKRWMMARKRKTSLSGTMPTSKSAIFSPVSATLKRSQTLAI